MTTRIPFCHIGNRFSLTPRAGTRPDDFDHKSRSEEPASDLLFVVGLDRYRVLLLLELNVHSNDARLKETILVLKLEVEITAARLDGTV